MQENQIDLLTDDAIQLNIIPRKKLFPLWIKIQQTNNKGKNT